MAPLAVATGLLEIAASGRLHHGQAWRSRIVALGVTGAVTAALGAAAIGMGPDPANLRVLLLVGAVFVSIGVCELRRIVVAPAG